MTKRFEAIHLLAIAEAITEINTRASYLMLEVQTVADLLDHMSHDQLKTQVAKLSASASNLRAAMFPGEEV